MNGQEQFLHPPPEGVLVPAELQDLVEKADREIEQAFPSSITAESRDQLLRTEAVHSAAIEDEYDPERVERHHWALYEFLNRPLDPESLLEMHRNLMKGQPHSEPGRYRSQRLIAGWGELPEPALAAALMDGTVHLSGNRERKPAKPGDPGHLGPRGV